MAAAFAARTALITGAQRGIGRAASVLRRDGGRWPRRRRAGPDRVARLHHEGGRPRPFVWTKTVGQIPGILAAYCERMNNSGVRLGEISPVWVSARMVCARRPGGRGRGTSPGRLCGLMSATPVVRGLAVAYGERSLFRDLDVVVGPGDVVGLVGVNGAGKSTLLRVLAGLRPADAGTATIRYPGRRARHRSAAGHFLWRRLRGIPGRTRGGTTPRAPGVRRSTPARELARRNVPPRSVRGWRRASRMHGVSSRTTTRPDASSALRLLRSRRRKPARSSGRTSGRNDRCFHARRCRPARRIHARRR